MLTGIPKIGLRAHQLLEQFLQDKRQIRDATFDAPFS